MASRRPAPARLGHAICWRSSGALLLGLVCSCGTRTPEARPNVLFVVWDTVRADHLSLYGHARETTPALDSWAEGALVFEDCRSTASSTVPSHGAMFTGLYPSEHGANNRYLQLDAGHETLAEIFQAAGYGTYLYAANPHLSAAENFSQGFGREEHPWDADKLDAALTILAAKTNPEGLVDTSSELPDKLRAHNFQTWDVKATGALAERSLLRWLDTRAKDEPFFAFINYMEAHRPYVPSPEARRAFMDERELPASYAVDRSWERTWSYTFGLEELTPEELNLTELTYDACLLELDQLFAHLMQSLTAAGHLEDTIVVLVGDHGEHLGEQHMLDHQYSLYQGLLHVPLVLWNPKRIEPGRSTAPVANFDIFPTLLELCGLEATPGVTRQARSLLRPNAQRERLSEYPSDFEYPIRSVRAVHPTWDPTPFERRLSAFQRGDHKLIWASDGRNELYDLARDPGEQHDLASIDSERLQALEADLGNYLKGLHAFEYGPRAAPELSRDQAQRLQALGYFSSIDDD